MFRYIIVFLLSVSLLLSPVAGGVASAFSVGDEKELGEKLLSTVRSSFHLLDEPDIHQYINKLGNEILTVTGTQFFDYHFFVIGDKDFNAFAAPSGLIFINSGLIEAMDSEGELISVMAHECGHVTSRHIADRIKKSTKTSIATVAMIIAGIAIGGGALSEALVTGSMAAGTSLNLKFSRQDEEEADRLAYSWMKQMKIDPREMSTMLGKMYKISVYRMSNIPPYLLTHPEPKRRQGYVQDLIMMDEKAANLEKRDNFNFLRIKQRIISLTSKPEHLKKISTHQLDQKDISAEEELTAHYGLHLVYLDAAKYEEAETELLKVRTAYPDRAILLTDQGVIHLKKGDASKAMEFFQAARKIDPQSYYNKFNMAQAWQQLNDDAAALRIYYELLAENPDYSRMHYQIGQINIKQQKKGAGHYHLGLYYWYEGDAKLAKYHLDQTIASQDSDEALKRKAKDFKKKIAEFEKS